MDDESRAELIVQAKLQNAHAEIKRARANVPVGVALIVLGLVITIAVAMLPLGLIGKVLIAGIGFAFIPGGTAVLIRSAGTISRGKREIRELGPPVARALK